MKNYYEQDPDVDRNIWELRSKINQLLLNDGIETDSRPTYGVDNDSEQVQFEVRQIIKSCLKVEDEAMLMRNKKTKQQDLLYHSPGKTLTTTKQTTFLT